MQAQQKQKEMTISSQPSPRTLLTFLEPEIKYSVVTREGIQFFFNSAGVCVDVKILKQVACQKVNR